MRLQDAPWEYEPNAPCPTCGASHLRCRSDATVARSLSSTGGTVAAARAVCDGRAAIAGHIAGGTHHAFYDRGGVRARPATARQ